MLYRSRKANLSKKIKKTKAEYFEYSFCKFIPSLIIYKCSKANEKAYTQELLSAFYLTHEKEINAFIQTRYFGDFFDLSKDFVETKKMFEDLKYSCTQDLQKYCHDFSTVSTLVNALKVVSPEFDDEISKQLALAVSKKRTRYEKKENPKVEFSALLDNILNNLGSEEFFRFLELTDQVQLPKKTLISLKN